MIFFRIWLKNFFLPKVIWEHHSIDFLYTQKPFLVTVMGIFGRRDQFFSVPTIKDLPILFLGNKGIFVNQNQYGYTSSFSRFWSNIFVIVTIDQKVAST